MEYRIEIGSGRKLSISYRNINHDRLIVFIPGVSGNAMSDRFKYLENIGVECDYSFVRMDFQFQQYKDQSLTVKDCVKDVLAVLEYLKRRDINTTKEKVIIAKSFGAIIYHLLDTDIRKGILLAPYTMLKDKKMNFLETRLQDLKDSDTYLDKNILRDNPTLIFHGTHDKVIDAANSEEMTKINKNYRIIKVDSDHGFNENEVQKTIIRRAVEFIKD